MRDADSMTADDTAPPIRLDRYIALLAILLAFVLGLLIISEQQRALDPNRIEGTVPPPEELLDRLARERQALLEEQTRLAEALAPTEQALRSVESEVGALAKEAARLHDLLGAEAMQSRELAQRVAAVEADRDRLSAKVDSMMASQEALAARLAEIEARAAPAPDTEPLPEPAAGGGEVIEPEPTVLPDDDQSLLPELLQAPASDVAGPLLRGQAAGTGTISAAESSAMSVADGGGPDASAADPPSGRQTGRMITFEGERQTAADGVEAYRAGEYQQAGRIWRSLAMNGDMRAQFYLGSLLFEGRLGQTDLVMAYVWLKRSVDSGYLPAIEMRRRVRASMSEEEYERALALQSNS
jgi:TPR repeat protein